MTKFIKLTFTAAVLICTAAHAWADPVAPTTVTRDFFSALSSRDFDRAGKLVVPERYPTEKLQKLQESLRVEDAKLQEAYAGREQVAVITDAISPRVEGRGRIGRWGISLRRQGDVWLIRDMDFLPDAQAVEKYLAGFRKVEPDAQRLEITK